MKAGEEVGDYILDKRLGAGGVGEVWLAHHKRDGDVVAVKAIFPHLAEDPQFRKRFLREAEAMASLEHPRIVKVRDYYALGGALLFVMTYLDGGSLEDKLSKNDPLPKEEILRMSRDILDGLNYAHKQGVIHRDVKPSNILLDREGHAYLTDFGIALVVGEKRLTRTGSAVGTPEYMSPEQIKSVEIDHRTDVYSFGCVLYEMFTGRPPFGDRDGGDTEFTIMEGHTKTAPPALRSINADVDPDMESVVLRALAKNPDERFGGCEEMAMALAFPGGSRSLSPEKSTKSSSVLYAAVVLLVLTTSVTGWGWYKTHQQLEQARSSPAGTLNPSATQSPVPGQLKDLENRLTAVGGERDEAKKKVQLLTREAGITSKQLAHAKQEQRKLEKKLKEVAQRLFDAETARDAAKGQVAVVTREDGAESQELNQLRQDRKKLESDVMQTGRRLAAATTARDQAEQHAKRLEHDIALLEEKVIRLTKRKPAPGKGGDSRKWELLLSKANAALDNANSRVIKLSERLKTEHETTELLQRRLSEVRKFPSSTRGEQGTPKINAFDADPNTLVFVADKGKTLSFTWSVSGANKVEIFEEDGNKIGSAAATQNLYRLDRLPERTTRYQLRAIGDKNKESTSPFYRVPVYARYFMMAKAKQGAKQAFNFLKKRYLQGKKGRGAAKVYDYMFDKQTMVLKVAPLELSKFSICTGPLSPNTAERQLSKQLLKYFGNVASKSTVRQESDVEKLLNEKKCDVYVSTDHFYRDTAVDYYKFSTQEFDLLITE